jgi:hypothetical protein
LEAWNACIGRLYLRAHRTGVYQGPGQNAHGLPEGHSAVDCALPRPQLCSVQTSMRIDAAESVRSLRVGRREGGTLRPRAGKVLFPASAGRPIRQPRHIGKLHRERALDQETRSWRPRNARNRDGGWPAVVLAPDALPCETIVSLSVFPSGERTTFERR